MHSSGHTGLQGTSSVLVSETPLVRVRTRFIPTPIGCFRRRLTQACVASTPPDITVMARRKGFLEISEGPPVRGNRYYDVRYRTAAADSCGSCLSFVGLSRLSKISKPAFANSAPIISISTSFTIISSANSLRTSCSRFWTTVSRRQDPFVWNRNRL
jgi:hypothetical protein